jgi:hypothetical protein
MLGSPLQSSNRCKTMTSRTRLLVPLIACLALVTGCGGSDTPQPASGQTDVSSLLRSTFANLGKLKSGTVDLKLGIEPRGAAAAQGQVSARLQGPFASQGTGKLPKFAFNATLTSGGRSVNAGATWTGDKAFIGLQGEQYQVSDVLVKQFIAGYEEALKTRKSGSAGGLVLGGLGIDFTKWLRDPRNEGAAKVGDADTIKISGAADVERVLTDLDKISERARSLNVPGAAGKVPQKLTPQQRTEAAKAIKALNVTVYTGASDKLLRRLVVDADLNDAASSINAKILLDLTFTNVGQEQQVTAPQNAKPFSELLKAVDASGLGNLGGLAGGASGSGAAVPGATVTPNNVDKYAACIAKANGDKAKARKCASLLSG